MEPKKAHFIGICGVGMSAAAALLREAGWSVTGSCTTCYPPVRTFLEDNNLLTFEDHKRRNIPDGTGLVVAGASAALDRTQNEEVDEAHVRGIPVKTFPEVLNEVAAGKETIVVAGSYGKTTCTTLVTWLLRHAGTDPSYFIGALVPQLPIHGHLGDGTAFVIEGDEYPTSGIDNRSKFLLFPSHNVLLTSADHDHVNKFPTHEAYLEPFRKLLAQIPEDGLLVACSDNEPVRALARSRAGNTVTYGTNLAHSPDWSARAITHTESGASFELWHKNEKIADIKTTLLGTHNVQNIVGAAAMVLEKKLLTPQQVIAAVSDFEGITRRLDRKTSNSTVAVYEGFGSSREKAIAAIDAMRAHFPGRRLVVVFEPHTFSWRNKGMLHWYDDVFANADEVLIYHPPDINTTSHEQSSHEEIVARVQQAGVSAVPIQTEQEGLEALKQILKKDDVVLMLTSGNLDGMVQSIPTLVEKLFPLK